MIDNLRTYNKMIHILRQWHPSERKNRIENMALFMMGLFMGESVHLSKIVRQWPLPAKELSMVNRLRRFLNNKFVVSQTWYRPIADHILQSFKGLPIKLVIDCSKVGFYHRLMMIGVAYKKRTIPLVWSVHRGAKGHVSVEKQLKLFRYLLPLIPRGAKVTVLGDAGFETAKLMNWLRQQGWKFVIRQNGRSMVKKAGENWVKLNQISVKEGDSFVYGWIRLTKTHDAGWFYLVVHWEKGEKEPWFLLSNFEGRHLVIKEYKIRMWIEEMFGDMKGHGFDLEKTHLDDEGRIDTLVLGVAIVFTWFISLGSRVVKSGNRHWIDAKSRRDKSYFRLGWDWIMRIRRLNQPIPIGFTLYF